MSSQPLNGRVAIVTGAAQGLGAVIADALATAGASVALWDREKARLANVLASLPKQDSQRHFAFAGDLSSDVDVRKAVKEIQASLSRIDILVNSAGGSGSQSVRDIEDVTVELWQQTIANNLTSTFLCCKHVVPVMRQNRYGRIVNFSSGLANGQAGPLGPVGVRLPYATAKAAITAFSKQLAKDLAGTGITVNTIAPGLIVPAKSGRVRERFESLASEERAAIFSAIPMGRAGEADEIAYAVNYLVSEHAGFTSGALLSVDGAAS